MRIKQILSIGLTAAFLLSNFSTEALAAVATGQLRVHVTIDNTAGGNLTSSDIPYQFSGQPVQAEVWNTFPATIYLLELNDPAGFASRVVTGSGSGVGNCSGTGYVDLYADEMITCNIDYVSAPNWVTVTRTVDNKGFGTAVDADFPLVGNGVPMTSGKSKFFGLGDVLITTTSAFTNYIATFGGDCDATGKTTLTAGSNSICTVTYSYPTQPLTITKTVSGGSATADQFMIDTNVNGTTTTAPGAATPGTTIQVPVGANFNVAEQSAVNYTTTYQGTCSGTMSNAPVSCDILNTFIATVPTTTGNLIVITQVTNNNTGTRTATDFVTTVNGTNASTSSFPGSLVGTTLTLEPGSYSVSQDSTGYNQTLSAECSGTIAIGETKTCTISNDDIPFSNSSGGGNGGGGSSGGSGGGATTAGSSVPTTPITVIPGPSSSNGSSTPVVIIPRVLGESFTEISTTCLSDEPDAAYITANPDDLIRNLGLTQDPTLQSQMLYALVQKVIIPNIVSSDSRAAVSNFTSIGTRTNQRLGAGERAGVVDSFKAIYGRLPATECDWQEALRIANHKKPQTLNTSREASSMKMFAKIYKRAANVANTEDRSAIDIMTYGIRPVVRSLNAERKAIRVFAQVMKHGPGNATEWDTVRAIAYSGAAR